MRHDQLPTVANLAEQDRAEADKRLRFLACTWLFHNVPIYDEAAILSLMTLLEQEQNQ